MSALVKLSSKLPGDFEVNGLDGLVDDLVADPKTPLLAVVWLDVQKVTLDADSGAKVPTVRVRRIEPLGEVGQVSGEIRKAVAEKMEERTGRTPLPFEIVEVVEDRHSEPLIEVE